jgi:hypothetical protein
MSGLAAIQPELKKEQLTERNDLSSLPTFNRVASHFAQNLN